MKFKLVKQYPRGPELTVASFAELVDAELFVQTRLAMDSNLKISVVYRMMAFGDIIKEYDSTKTGESPGAQGQQSGENFRPSPFSSAPRPSGMPQNWKKEDPEQKDK